ncbi:hypothetical protein WJX74_001238 [Apatococcus lobatus]|uniref:Uncharacterized protein n=1 Tax=Apatococcus lobatus TaxID=904363 RepID=A0AAW1QMS6_9CHLO
MCEDPVAEAKSSIEACTIDKLVDECRRPEGHMTDQISIKFMDMMADRFARLEQENSKLHKANLHLQQQLDLRAPSLYLIPESRYMQFSDGFYLEWVLFHPTGGPNFDFSRVFDPVMVINQLGSHAEEVLDEGHWNAVVSPTSFWLVSRINMSTDVTFGGEEIDCHVQGKSSKGPVLLRDFVNAVKATLQQCGARGRTQGGAMHMRVWNGLIPVGEDLVAVDDEGTLRHQLSSPGLQMMFCHPLTSKLPVTH